MIDELINFLKTENIFLTGGAGVGKSYAVSKIIKHYKNENLGVVSLGSTGISAVNIGGLTLHSFFGFGICKNKNELSEYDKGSKAKERIKNLKNILDKTELIIIDEISMVSADLFEMIYLRLINLTYKGRVMVVGDFYQLPPIIKDQNLDLFQRSIYAFGSYSWEMMRFKNIELIKPKRTKNLEFFKVLSKIRVGKIGIEDARYLYGFTEVKFIPSSDETVLFGRNKEANELNVFMLEKINSPLLKHIGKTIINDNLVHKDRIDKWLNNLNVATTFEFKIGAKVIFTINKYKNILDDSEFYNGEQGVIKDVFLNDGEISEILVEKNNGELVEVKPNNYDFGEYINENDELKYNIIASFFQFPLRLAYAITIHKSQGMSIERLTCDLTHIFAEGQLYVALSRAIEPNNLKIVYKKSENFNSYLNRVIKSHKDVDEFYKKTDFLKYE
ncbi:ATP-dependent DNA helicase [Campylobacter ureolyticus]|uniref:ATP-dependent DNA helicase n=1 Tax=Campylobacter ureolyticus TaxID=827 RepID=UPI0022B50B66|nr:AAA family ATPase [Campylobacter ureolyticus]MCZ6111911.1 AAA family ATPase [Campylobacter ureolyticus]MDK8323459.1 AAA family ATPase [Campylobacter ureolyticus]